MKFNKSLAAIAAAAALLAAPLASQAGLVIDDFSIGQAELEDQTTGALPAVTSDYGTDLANGIGSSQAGATANIIGGERDMMVYKHTGESNRHVTAEVDALTDAFVYSADSNVRGFAVLRWDGINAYNNAIDIDGLGGIDLSATGVAISVDSDADQAYQLTFQVWTDTGGGYVLSELTKNIAAGVQDVFLLFSDFTGANFADVGAMQMIVNTGAATARLDVDLQIVGTVAEPGSIALAGLALLGLAAARRRKA